MITTLENKNTVPAQLEGEFQAIMAEDFASEPAWLKEKRREAFEKFSSTGIPTRRNEEYKYTDVRKVFTGNFSAIRHGALKPAVDPGKLSVAKDSIKLVFVNGWFQSGHTLTASLPKGAIIGNLATEGLMKHPDLVKKYWSSFEGSPDPFFLLNSALWCDGAFIFLPQDAVLENTIEIIHILTGEAELLVNQRHLIIAEKNAEAQVIEHSISINVQKRVIVNSAAGILTDENARLHYYKVQNENKNTFHLHNTLAVQKKNSHFDTNTITLDSAWVRNNLNISLEGRCCETHLNGLFLAGDGQHIDNHTRVYHGQPDCRSNQLYKGILDGKSTGVFNGKIFVERDAQKTNAYQSSKNILLTDDATINTKPELEIYADDVKCSHGSSTGKIDEQALFYLRARGLSEASARRLLLHAFASDVLDTVRIEGLKNYLEELIVEKLHG